MRLSPESSVGDLARAGALGRAVRRVWMGWSDGAIVGDLEDKFPGLTMSKYEAVVKLANQGVVAARLLRAMARHETINPDDVPLLPP